MHRRLSEPKLVVASHNAGKIREIAALLAHLSTQVVSAGDMGLPEPEETGLTFAANAHLKASMAASASGLPALADDSGLAVAALDGAPGIYSARWAGLDKDFALAMRKVEQALVEQKATTPDQRTAKFVCALCLAWPDGHSETFEGDVEGTLVWPSRGEKGFGYDPVFLPHGCSETFGEMKPEEKHAMSHRARAFALLSAACLVAD